MLSKEIIPQTSSDVKSNKKSLRQMRQEGLFEIVDISCPSCAKRATKKFRYVKPMRCQDCGEKHILQIFGLSQDEISSKLLDIVTCEFTFWERA